MVVFSLCEGDCSHLREIIRQAKILKFGVHLRMPSAASPLPGPGHFLVLTAWRHLHEDHPARSRVFPPARGRCSVLLCCPPSRPCTGLVCLLLALLPGVILYLTRTWPDRAFYLTCAGQPAVIACGSTNDLGRALCGGDAGRYGCRDHGASSSPGRIMCTCSCSSASRSCSPCSSGSPTMYSSSWSPLVPGLPCWQGS